MVAHLGSDGGKLEELDSHGDEITDCEESALEHCNSANIFVPSSDGRNFRHWLHNTSLIWKGFLKQTVLTLTSQSFSSRLVYPPIARITA